MTKSFAHQIDGQWVEARGSIVTANGSFTPAWLTTAPPEDVAAAGFREIVEPDGVPSGWRSEEIIDVGGVPTRAPPSLEDLKFYKRQAVETEYATRLALGFPLPGHPGQTLQCRTDHDRTNWIGLMMKCQMMVGAGAGSQPCDLPLRTTANLGVQFTYAETLQIMLAILQWSADMLAVRWALKDACDTAATAEDLAAIDLSSGWPA